MKFKENVSLKDFNTFGIDVSARYFFNFSSIDELNENCEVYSKLNTHRLVLGGGSNILFTKNFEGAIFKNDIKGINLIDEDSDAYFIKSGAGEIWHNLVLYCINRGYSGIENLSLIPGTVGAGPIQNIGAYGIELKDVFWELEAYRIEDGKIEVFDKDKCQFNYRDSIFKNKLRGTHIITSVTLKLPKNKVLNTSYGAINNELKKLSIQNPTAKDVSRAVINIRQSKLPNPDEIGNAGSFFKNPVVNTDLFNQLREKYPDIVGYPNPNKTTKLAAGWLIEHCGWKGKTFNNYGVHKNQSLVLVNYGGANGMDVYNLSEKIKQSVLEKFGVDLQREVWIV